MDFPLILAVLRSRSLGAPAAERDEELLKSFVYSDVYRDFADGKASIVIGSRGAGKSAIFRKLAEERRAANDCVVEISPEHYSYEIMSQSLRGEIGGSLEKTKLFFCFLAVYTLYNCHQMDM